MPLLPLNPGSGGRQGRCNLQKTAAAAEVREQTRGLVTGASRSRASNASQLGRFCFDGIAHIGDSDGDDKGDDGDAVSLGIASRR